MPSGAPWPIAPPTRCQDRSADELAWSEQRQALYAADGQVDVFITVDKNLVHQQSLAGFRLAVVLLRAQNNTTEHPSALVTPHLATLESIKPGEVVTIGA